MDPRKRVPIRWLAPETLRTAMYTQKTDVYSYGIMCWEIFANGQEPYPGFTVAEVNVRVGGIYFISPGSSEQLSNKQAIDNGFSLGAKLNLFRIF